MTHLYHLFIILTFPAFFLTAFLLWLWFTNYKFIEIVKLGWRAYDN